MKCKHCAGQVKEARRLPYKSRKSRRDYRFYICDQCGIAFPVARADFDVNSPRLIHKRKIAWKCYVPRSFPCFLCGRGRGEWSVHLGVGDAIVKAVLCTGCANLPVVVVAEGFVGGGKIAESQHIR